MDYHTKQHKWLPIGCCAKNTKPSHPLPGPGIPLSKPWLCWLDPSVDKITRRTKSQELYAESLPPAPEDSLCLPRANSSNLALSDKGCGCGREISSSRSLLWPQPRNLGKREAPSNAPSNAPLPPVWRPRLPDLQESHELQHTTMQPCKTNLPVSANTPETYLAAENGWNEGWALLTRSTLRAQLDNSWTRGPGPKGPTGQL